MGCFRFSFSSSNYAIADPSEESVASAELSGSQCTLNPMLLCSSRDGATACWQQQIILPVFSPFSDEYPKQYCGLNDAAIQAIFRCL